MTSTTAPVPVTVTDEAAEEVAGRHLGEAAARALAEAARLLPGLTRLRLAVQPAFDMDDGPWLVVECHGPADEGAARAGLLDWYAWRASALPPEVGRRFLPLLVPADAGRAG